MEKPSTTDILPPIFVNREEELQAITQTVEDLQDKHRLIRTPLLEFSGVQGIGKSTLLEQVKLICTRKSVRCISAEARRITPQHFQDVEDLAEKEEPVVMIVDALDDINGDTTLLQDIESHLSRLLENSKWRLFVIIASRGVHKFERTRSIKRKLTIRHLKPLEQKHCRQYLSNFAQEIPPEIWDSIFDWTQGYPLALTTMTRAVRSEGLNPQHPEDQKQLINTLMQEIVDKTLLRNAISPYERDRLKKLIGVLSIPRRFNITLAQDLIEHFAPQYQFESSLAYITLPQAINEVTSLLSYKLEIVGYSIDTPIRNLFLLYYNIIEPQEYIQVQQFLAQQNESFVEAVSGSDRVRYLREFFYHLATFAEQTTIQEKLTHYIRMLAQIQGQDERNLVRSLEGFRQFYEEFQRDEELKDALKQNNTRFVLSLMYNNFIEIHRQIPENMRERWLIQFFSLVTDQSQKDDFPFIFEEGMRHIIKQVSRNEAIKLYNDLVQDEQVILLLGEQLENVRTRVIDNLLNEG